MKRFKFHGYFRVAASDVKDAEYFVDQIGDVLVEAFPGIDTTFSDPQEAPDEVQS